MSSANFAVACPIRSVCDHHARVFASLGRLQGHYLGTRRGSDGIPESLSKRFPLVGLLSYVVAKTLPDRGEAAKVACFPMFDRWVARQVPPETAVLSSYGYVVETFRKARASGGSTFLDGGNSHFAHYWREVSEEHSRWNCDLPPFPRPWLDRGLRSIELTDWVFSPSRHVTDSFVREGFPNERILQLPYPVNLGHFSPDAARELPESPLRVVCTGGVTLRKGFPYLLEAMRILRESVEAELLLTDIVHPSMRPVLAKYPDIPISWAPMLPHEKLGERLKSAHVFALLSIEEGLARTALEAMACGVPVVLTPATGASDFVIPGVNGEVVPVRSAAAAAAAILRCRNMRIPPGSPQILGLHEALSFERFSHTLREILKRIDAPRPGDGATSSTN
jgi:glycosyltransferase involved in cell wall biosynthesis